MEYKIVTSNRSDGLNTKVKEMIEEGWKPVGSHQVVTNFMQNRFSGLQIHSSTYENEYSQTMIKE